jgi:hypothetical protein
MRDDDIKVQGKGRGEGTRSTEREGEECRHEAENAGEEVEMQVEGGSRCRQERVNAEAAGRLKR